MPVLELYFSLFSKKRRKNWTFHPLLCRFSLLSGQIRQRPSLFFHRLPYLFLQQKEGCRLRGSPPYFSS